ncbi:hypothetical protein HHK36_011559 [Tetracentron sinense]|uniref:Uncharacterized protein n=1 Tax=Tetracentron sinense TaxID=13715 RepID=A0A834ZD66_TETSI|nr:hypothetical protein HHK36_011559 [Tetracentron sinense]
MALAQIIFGFLNTTEILDQDGKSSLLSFVKAFDSVLAVYEGFCNLNRWISSLRSGRQYAKFWCGKRNLVLHTQSSGVGSEILCCY